MQHGVIAKEQLDNLRATLRMPIDSNPFGILAPLPAGTTVEGLPANRLDDLKSTQDDKLGDPGDSKSLPAGFTFFGQFIDHDVTLAHFEAGTDDLTQPQSLDKFTNLRTAELDLDSVFGFGPENSQELYDGERLKTGEDVDGLQPFDVPRDTDQRAVIGDPRNDENKIVVQVHASMIRAYNRMLQENPVQGGAAFEGYARNRLRLTLTYQNVVINDYLRRSVDPNVFNATKANGAQRYAAMMQAGGYEKPIIPVEFAVAAFRFGHSQVRGGYGLNFEPGSGAALFVETDDNGNLVGPDLGGGVALPPNLRMESARFFTDGPLAAANQINKTRKIDTKLVPALNLLRPPAIDGDNISDKGPGPNPNSLALRNLMRATQVALGNGYQVAAALGVSPLTPADMDLGADLADVADNIPLWFYILREAEIEQKGERLGTVGSIILCETFFGIMEHAPRSYFKPNPFGAGDAFTSPDNINTMAELMEFGSFVPQN